MHYLSNTFHNLHLEIQSEMTEATSLSQEQPKGPQMKNNQQRNGLLGTRFPQVTHFMPI